MFKVNYLLTGVQNIVRMLGASVSYRYRLYSYDLDIVSLAAIAPASSNSNKNTQITIAGHAKSGWRGQSTLYYNRWSLPMNRPSQGTALAITNGETHSSIRSKILTKWQIVADQVTFTYPSAVPEGQKSASYVVSAVQDSYLYLPTPALTVTVSNTSPVPTFDPANFFGASIGTRNGKKVYWLAPSTLDQVGDVTQDSSVAFLKLVALRNLLAATRPLTASNMTLSLMAAHSTTSFGGKAGNTFIDFAPGPDSPLSEGGTFFYTRLAFSYNGYFSQSGFPSTWPNLSQANLVIAVREWYKVPTGSWTSGSVIYDLLGRRTVRYAMAAADRMMLPGNNDVSFTTFII